MSNINLGTDMYALDVGLKQAAFTGVLLHAGKDDDGNDLDYMAGTTSGQVLEVTVPNGNLVMAYNILDRVKKRGYRYQPFESRNTIADPAAEIGDNVTANGTASVIMGIAVNHSRLMASTMKAPFDEETNHEWKYEPRSVREFRRESGYTRSRLTINADNISAEVVRASDAENALSGRIDINADSIAAKVSKTGGSSSSFGWELTDSSWTLTSNNSTVLRATSSGIEIMGKITATSGYIGTVSSGFEIGSNYIRNGMTSRDDTTNSGVYIGTDGIALGAGKFKVTSAGAVTASDLSITGGSIRIGGTSSSPTFYVDSNGNLTANNGTFRGNVSAGNIQYGVVSGVDYGTFSGSGISPNTIGINTPALTSGVVSGINWGSNFGSMATYGAGSGGYTADWVACNHLVCYGTLSGKHMGTWVYNEDTGDAYAVSWQSKSVVTESGGYSLNSEFLGYVESATSAGYIAIYGYSLSGSGDETSTIRYLGR